MAERDSFMIKVAALLIALTLVSGFTCSKNTPEESAEAVAPVETQEPAVDAAAEGEAASAEEATPEAAPEAAPSEN